MREIPRRMLRQPTNLERAYSLTEQTTPRYIQRKAEKKELQVGNSNSRIYTEREVRDYIRKGEWQTEQAPTLTAEDVYSLAITFGENPTITIDEENNTVGISTEADVKGQPRSLELRLDKKEMNVVKTIFII